MRTKMRTHHCGELNKTHLGQNISLCGWVNKVRDLGGLTFIDIRDRYGVTQLNFESFGALPECSLESTIQIEGVVRERPAEARNTQMSTGEIEVLVSDFRVLSLCDKDKLPFLPHGQVDSSEHLKLKYRYLDIRGSKLQKMLQTRAEATRKIRNFLSEQNFTEVETPILYKSTPEGARDYLVPSRVHPGKVYALPQSPQTLKQLLMIGGTDRYFQIVKCFRDEDLRADRQPEFTQVDIEASFVEEEDIRLLAENLIKEVFPVEKDFVLESMTFDEAMEKYGSDKPDLRFGLPHENVTSLFESSEFKVFSSVAQARGLVKCLYLSETNGTLARKDIDALAEVVKPFGGKGVAWFKNQGDEISGGISKFITQEILSGLKNLASYDGGNGLWLFFADNDSEKTHAFADAVRRHLGKKCELIKPGHEFRFVTKFPLLEYDKEDKRFYARHHPFTMPHPDDLEKFRGGKQTDLENCKAAAYDVVCNGYEMGGGSIRIYQQDIQKKMFEVLGMSEEEVLHQFGFFVEALNYGTPPHAGIAFGLDRLVMLLAGTENIRDVIAFPKTATASDLMSGAPSKPHEEQWKELNLKSIAKN